VGEKTRPWLARRVSAVIPVDLGVSIAVSRAERSVCMARKRTGMRELLDPRRSRGKKRTTSSGMLLCFFLEEISGAGCLIGDRAR
jgi:hypothetical protein